MVDDYITGSVLSSSNGLRYSKGSMYSYVPNHAFVAFCQLTPDLEIHQSKEVNEFDQQTIPNKKAVSSKKYC